MTVAENVPCACLTRYLNTQIGDRHRSLWVCSFPCRACHLQQGASSNQTDQSEETPLAGSSTGILTQSGL